MINPFKSKKGLGRGLSSLIVDSEKIDDQMSKKLSFEISQKIQNEKTYPGQVKVTVIRETRAVNVAT